MNDFETINFKIRSGHPDFLNLPWEKSIADWDCQRFVDFPRGPSRHQVRFIAYDEGIYVIKELPTASDDVTVVVALFARQFD